MTTAYQHRPLSKILAPQADKGQPSPTPNEDKGADNDAGNQIPEKYRNKSVEDVIEMHLNAERRIGTLSNELGTMRGIVTDLSAITRQAPASQTSAEDDKVDLSGDDLIKDPVGAIRKVVKHDLSRAELSQKEAQLTQQVASETSRLMNDYGDIASIVNQTDFQDFANRTEGRKADFQTAAYGSGMEQVRAARRLLEDFNDYQSLTAKQSEEKKESNVEAAKKASTEGGGNKGRPSSKPTFRESEVLKIIQNEPEKWRSPSYQKDILSAIKEGRYIKNA